MTTIHGTSTTRDSGDLTVHPYEIEDEGDYRKLPTASVQTN